MTTQEANKIIAEYMGFRLISQPHSMGRNPLKMEVKRDKGWEFEITAYSKSLDALVPVWETFKDKDDMFSSRFWLCDDNQWGFRLFGLTRVIGHGETIQEAACIATAKAISYPEAACIATAKAIKELNND